MGTPAKNNKSEENAKPDAQKKAKPASSADSKNAEKKNSTKKAKFENPKDDPA